MKRLHALPAAFKRFQKIGGVLDFGVFDECDGTDAEIVEAIKASLRHARRFDGGRLIELGSRECFKEKLLGDWYDPSNESLVKIGHWRTSDGRELKDPSFKALESVKLTGGAGAIPDVGAGGQLAFAFSQPPYSLQAKSREVQELFDAILAFVLPPGASYVIKDWSRPELVEVSDYFEAGADWWGVFLFTIHVPGMNRLTVIAGSTTD